MKVKVKVKGKPSAVHRSASSSSVGCVDKSHVAVVSPQLGSREWRCFLGWGLQVGEVNGSKSIVLRPVPYTRGLSLLVAVGGVKRFFGHVIPGCLSDLRSLRKKLLVRV